MLIERGIEIIRIITLACPKLAGRIERVTHSEETLGLVDQYVSEALKNTPDDNNPIFASFNCTHYGYISDVFEEKFKAKDKSVSKVLDPNPKMGDFIFNETYINRYENTEVSIKIVSQPELNDTRIKSIGSLIEKVSPKTALAMKKYKFTPELFEWESIANPEGKKN